MQHRNPKAFTLIEMLVALTASLILFGAVMTIFQVLGDTVGRSRRMTQLNEQMCQIANVIQTDLSGITARRTSAGLECPADAMIAEGYFEIIEGPDSDLLDFRPNDQTVINKGDNADFDRLVGDCDDGLFMTVSSRNAGGFTGKFGARTITSSAAEVAYFCRPTPNTANPTQYTLYRRQLLVSPGETDINFVSNATPPFFSQWKSTNWNTFGDFVGDFAAAWNSFHREYDLSVRRDTRGTPTPTDDRLTPNTLADLQIRRNRFAHDYTPTSAGLPIPIHPVDLASPILPLSLTRVNEDVIARNVISFDVKVLDPLANARLFGGPATTVLQPGDQDYFRDPKEQISPFSSAMPVFADLGFSSHDRLGANPPTPSQFDSTGHLGPLVPVSAFDDRTYDTWSTTYLTNNHDDDDSKLSDDLSEGPPYPSPLQAVKITIRLYDQESLEIKQRTILMSLL